jgi:hypothetical protein
MAQRNDTFYFLNILHYSSRRERRLNDPQLGSKMMKDPKFLPNSLVNELSRDLSVGRLREDSFRDSRCPAPVFLEYCDQSTTELWQAS